LAAALPAHAGQGSRAVRVRSPRALDGALRGRGGRARPRARRARRLALPERRRLLLRRRRAVTTGDDVTSTGNVLEIERTDGLVVATINRPERRNAIDAAVWQGLRTLVDE